MKINGLPSPVIKFLLLSFFLLIVVVGFFYATKCDTYRDAIIQGTATIALVFTLMLMMFQYMDSRDPVITFNIQQTALNVPCQNAAGQGAWLLRTFVNLENKSNFDTIVWVNLNLQIDNQKTTEAGELYTGEKPWTVAATAPITGAHFDLYSVMNQNAYISASDIKVCVEIKYKGSFGRIIKKIPQRWHLDRHNGIWIYDV